MRSISSAAWTPFAFASYARWAPRICIIASTIETLERSSMPNAIDDVPCAPGANVRARPDAPVGANSVAPSGRSASGAANDVVRVQ